MWASEWFLQNQVLHSVVSDLKLSSVSTILWGRLRGLSFIGDILIAMLSCLRSLMDGIGGKCSCFFKTMDILYLYRSSVENSLDRSFVFQIFSKKKKRIRKMRKKITWYFIWTPVLSLYWKAVDLYLVNLQVVLVLFTSKCCGNFTSTNNLMAPSDMKS